MKLSLLSYSFSASVASLVIIRGGSNPWCVAGRMGEGPPPTDHTNYAQHNSGKLATQIGQTGEEHVYDTETQGGDDDEFIFNEGIPTDGSKNSKVDPPFVEDAPAYVNPLVNYKQVAKMDAPNGEDRLPLSDLHKGSNNNPNERTKDGKVDLPTQQYEASFRDNVIAGEPPSGSNYQGASTTWRRKKKKNLYHRMNPTEHSLLDKHPHRETTNPYVSNFHGRHSNQAVVQHRVGKLKLRTNRDGQKMVKDILTPQVVKVMKEYLLKRRKINANGNANGRMDHLGGSSSDQLHREGSPPWGNSLTGSSKVSHPLRFFPANLAPHSGDTQPVHHK
ncbi:DegP-like serine protease 1 [Plasmodium coatneyi]|uniref:DegP-like serine protease 1 n=1 Tax=Plasmodium coatneyi TaxID=208452 RepID=A0A1B1DST2_9APIC|nr:DegP-like serine protease 1 [Plasmodium coatneyi]ANQ05856.1 DegP-like serine protease 1 [Plasmodium coatneyi]